MQLESRHESLRLRLLQTGVAEPAWLVFFSAVDAARSQAPALPGLPSVPDDNAAASASLDVLFGKELGGAPGTPSANSVVSSVPTLRHAKRTHSQKSMRSIRSEEQLSPRVGPPSEHIGSVGAVGSPSLGSLRVPIFASQASMGDASHSIFSISACSWSFSTDGYKTVVSRSLSDGQTQTELVWNDLGWQCRNCQKPPRPPSTPPDLTHPAPVTFGKTRPKHKVLSHEERRNDQILRMQGCWVLCNGPSKMVGWLHGFVITGEQVRTTQGATLLQYDDQCNILLAGGRQLSRMRSRSNSCVLCVGGGPRVE